MKVELDGRLTKITTQLNVARVGPKMNLGHTLTPTYGVKMSQSELKNHSTSLSKQGLSFKENPLY